MVRASKWRAIWNDSSKLEMMRLMITTIPALTARPSKTPTAADTSA